VQRGVRDKFLRPYRFFIWERGRPIGYSIENLDKEDRYGYENVEDVGKEV